MLEKSESIKNLAVALKKAQDEIGAVKFDAKNPFFNSKYATLGAIIEASKPALSKNGLTISQPVISEGDGIGVTTILLHESGEYLSSTATINVGEVKGKSIAQEAGSIITYLRRYALAAILNIYSDEDTDGNKVEEKPVAKPQVKAMTLAQAEAMTGSDDKQYRDCNDDELRGKQIGITKALNKQGVSVADRAELESKLTAVNMILKARRGG